MDTKKLKQIQNQYYNEEDYNDDNEPDELLQENTEDLQPDNEAVLVKQGQSAKNKIASLITQVEKGASQPDYQQKDEMDDDFFVEDEIVVGPQRESDIGK